jgi:hypothetical protein
MRFLYDTHVHTQEASCCGTSTAEEQVRAFKKKGYTGIIITDHFVKGYTNFDESKPWDEQVRFFISAYEKAKKEGDRIGLDVFLGWEYTSAALSQGLDFLTYGLTPKFLLAYPDILDIPIEAYSALVRKHGGYLAQAHPFRDIKKDPQSGPIDYRLMDGVEVYNSGKPGWANDMAYEFAIRHNLPIQAGSDSHHVDYPTTPCGITLKNKAKNIFDIINAIVTRKVEICSV